MATITTFKVTPKLEVVWTSATATGGTKVLTFNLPPIVSPASVIKAIDLSGLVTKVAAGAISLSVSTPVNIDLTAIATLDGDTSFTKLFCVGIFNNRAVAGGAIVIGGAGTNAFIGPFGSTTGTLDVAPQTGVAPFTLETAGWTVDATHKLLKINPGAATGTPTIILGGA